MCISKNTHVRIARPTDNMDAVVRFYRDGLGFEVTGSFQNHDSFDGVILAHPGAAYQLEFTHKPAIEWDERDGRQPAGFLSARCERVETSRRAAGRQRIRGREVVQPVLGQNG